MHLGLLLYGSLDTLSGGYLYDRKLVEYLRKQGDEVEIISIPWRNYASHLTDNFNPALYRRLKNFQGDILLQDELNHPSLFLLNRLLIRNTKYAILSLVHHLRASEQHPAWLMPLYRAVERAYLRTLDGCVFNSWTTKRAVEALMGRAADRCVVAPPGGDRFAIPMGDADIVRRAKESGPLRLLFVGNVIPRKGLHVIFEALSHLRKETWELHIVGELRVARDYMTRLRKDVIQKNWEDRVFFYGALEDGQVAEWMAKSHLLVMPSSYEGFGIAYLEGMGFGLPALATTSGAAGEIITDGENGFLIAPGDARALAETLRWLHEDRNQLAEMSLAARKRYEAYPGWEASMAGIRDFLRLPKFDEENP